MRAYRTYIIVWVALLILTLLTWGVSYINLGMGNVAVALLIACLLYTSPSPRDMRRSRMPSSA